MQTGLPGERRRSGGCRRYLEGEEKEGREWFSKKNGIVCRVWEKMNKVVISEGLERERRMLDYSYPLWSHPGWRAHLLSAI